MASLVIFPPMSCRTLKREVILIPFYGTLIICMYMYNMVFKIRNLPISCIHFNLNEKKTDLNNSPNILMKKMHGRFVVNVLDFL